MNKELKTELIELRTLLFLAGGELEHSHYSCDFDPPFNDFNKDVHHPGCIATYKMDNDIDKEYIEYIDKNGILSIRADDNFWVVSNIPYKFKELTIQEIVAILWPDRKETAIYHNDADDKEYWQKHFEPMYESRKPRRKKPEFE